MKLLRFPQTGVMILLACIILFSGFTFGQRFDPDLKIGLVHSEKTKNLIYPINNDFNPTYEWELFFLNNKIKYQIIYDNEFGSRKTRELQLLIFPSVEVLSNTQFEEIKRLLEEGKGVFIFGKFGRYDETGKERRENFLSEIANITMEELPLNDELAVIHTLIGGTPLTQEIPSGEKLMVIKRFPLYQAQPADERVKVYGRYYRNGQLFRQENKLDASGIISSTYKNGRIIWIGFQLNQLEFDAERTRAIKTFLSNSFAWLAGKPKAYLSSWPLSLQSAAVITCYLDNASFALSKFNELLKENGLRANYFLTNSLLKNNPELAVSLSAYGDVDLCWSGYNFAGLSYDQKSTLFKSAVTVLKNNINQKSRGLRALDLTLSGDEKKIVSEAGFNYILKDESGLSLLPEKELSSSRWIYYKESNEAHDVFLDKGSAKTSKSEEIYLDDFNTAAEHGGVFNFNFLNQVYGSNESLDVESFKNLIARFKESGTWITTFSELNAWFGSSKNIIVSSSFSGGELSVIVQNNNPDMINDLVVKIPGVSNSASLIMKKNISEFKVNYDPQNEIYLLSIPYLRGNEKLTLEFSYNR